MKKMGEFVANVLGAEVYQSSMVSTVLVLTVGTHRSPARTTSTVPYCILFVHGNYGRRTSAERAKRAEPASGPERAGSSTLNPLALEEQPEAKQPATEQPETITSPRLSRSARLAKLREKAQERGGQPSVQAQAGGADRRRRGVGGHGAHE